MAAQQSDPINLDLLRDNLPATSQLFKSAALINLANIAAVDDDDTGSDSGTGSPGSIDPVMDLAVFGLTSTAEAALAAQIRQGEAKFGWVPETKDPDKKRQGSGARHEGPQQHPLLSNTQRFDGADPKLSASASDNPEASENFENRLTHDLRPTARPTQTPIATPTFKPI